MRATTDLYDDYEDSVQTCSVQFRDFGGKTRFSGPIRTVACLNDNVLFRTMLGEPGNGGVIVVDGGGSMDCALMGDMLAARGAANGIDIGVKALGVNPAKSKKDGAGSVDEPVEFGGVRFEPGAWVYCDEDGVLVAAQQLDT
jgi:regulator of ribonuclease activity A